MDFKVIIPARFASIRLPGKPLLEIAGKPMIQHVHQRATESGAAEVVIATDDQRIADVAMDFAAEVCLTSASHRSGTERIAEVAEIYGWDEQAILVNLQGDEPCMPAALISQVADDMDAHGDAQVTTLASPIQQVEQLFDPHVVKVVTDEQGYALYFSRAPIPWHRDEFIRQSRSMPAEGIYQRHIGLYAYRAGYLKRYTSLPPSPLEQAESLEQLRVLWHGDRLHVSKAGQQPGHGVDTADDLRRAARMLAD